MRPALTPEPTCAAYVTVEVPGRLAGHGEDVGVEVGVERELARAADGLREAHPAPAGRSGRRRRCRCRAAGAGPACRRRRGRRRAGSAAGPALLSSLAQHVEGDRRLRRCRRGRRRRVLDDLVALVALRLDGQGAGAVDARSWSGRRPRPGSGRSRRRASRRRRRRALSRSRRRGTSPGRAWPDPARSFGGVLTVVADDADGDLGGGPAVLGRRAVVDGVAERERVGAGLVGHRDLDGLAVGRGASPEMPGGVGLGDVAGRDREDRALACRSRCRGRAASRCGPDGPGGRRAAPSAACGLTWSSTRFSSFFLFLSSVCGGGMTEFQLSILTLLRSMSQTSPESRSLRTMRPRLTRSFTPSVRTPFFIAPRSTVSASVGEPQLRP